MMLKICGTASRADADLAVRAGADALGLIVRHPASPRHVELDLARDIARAAGAPIVAVSVNQTLQSLEQIAAQLAPLALQLHGDESPELVRQLTARGHTVWKAITGKNLLEDAARFSDAGAAALLVDARESGAAGPIYGGTGQLADWNAARVLVERGFRVILAGGLEPENVARAIETVGPWGVDVVSGVEKSKGAKDAAKVQLFVKAAREAATLLHL